MRIVIQLTFCNVSQTLTGKEIDIDIEPTDKVSTTVCNR